MREVNETVVKFGFPNSVIREYKNWWVLLRPAQLTAGSLVLAHKGTEVSLPELSESAYMELKLVTTDIANALESKLSPDQVNYLALMMVDPHVHFHVFPRYQSEKELCGEIFVDGGWPGLPDFSQQKRLNSTWCNNAVTEFKQVWSKL